MTLEILGSGFGRTGTMSTKIALEQLGFGPCHHMVEVMQSPEQQAHWKALSEGVEQDWGTVYSDYRSQVDFPGAAFWHELSIAFPDARVIHTERPEDDWWASFSATIGKFFQLRESLDLPPPVADIFKTMDKLLVKDLFGGLDRDRCIAAYRRNNEKVRSAIPADRLLVFTPADGWEPLCQFLDVAVPEMEFPRSNARDEFWAMFGGEPAQA